MERANEEDLPDSHLRFFEQALEGDSDDRLRSILSHLHAEQIADVLEALPTHQRLSVWKALESQSLGDVLTEMHREGRGRLVGEASSSHLVPVVQRLGLDELADGARRRDVRNGVGLSARLASRRRPNPWTHRQRGRRGSRESLRRDPEPGGSGFVAATFESPRRNGSRCYGDRRGPACQPGRSASR